MPLTPDIGVVLPAVIGATIGTVIGQRRLVRKHMPEQAERWFALSAADRLRIRWAVAWGDAVADARLAPLAAALARTRRTMWAQLSRRSYVLLWASGAALAIACIIALRDDGGVFYGAVILLAFGAEMVAVRSRGARLEQAERRNRQAPTPSAP